MKRSIPKEAVITCPVISSYGVSSSGKARKKGTIIEFNMINLEY
jgi:hypothetical protein